MASKDQFVGTRSLTISIKFLTLSIRYKQTRDLIQQYIEPILFNISLPLFLTTEKEAITFSTDPAEYVRLQTDCQNEYNVKKNMANLVEKLCSLKYGKKHQKLKSKYLGGYMQTIAGNL